MFRIRMLPAGRGDCLWIEYGDEAAPHRILVDGGIQSTHTRLRECIHELRGKKHFELLVVTHIDLDHIAGILALLNPPPEGLTLGDVWFNTWRHLSTEPPPQVLGILGSEMGEDLSALLRKRSEKWNTAFGDAAVVTGSHRQGVTLAGGMRVHVLGPTRRNLDRLIPVWKKELEEKGQEPGYGDLAEVGHPDEAGGFPGILGDVIDLEALAHVPYAHDTSKPNASSIALMLEFDGKRVLLAGDAHAEDLREALQPFKAGDGTERVRIDAFKISHHGGHKNTSRELLQEVACGKFLISTDGSYYAHPHPQTIARILTTLPDNITPRLFFNHESAQTRIWKDPHSIEGARYEPVYLTDTTPWIDI